MRHNGCQSAWHWPTRPTTVFLDRDGVINRHRAGDYVKDWTEFEFLPNAKQALRLLTEARYRIVVVTNQRGVARGFMTESHLTDIHSRMVQEAMLAGGWIEAVYYCPHDIGQCACRKPGTGLFLEAQQDLADLHFASSIVVGDSTTDMDAGARLGCKLILIGKSDQYPCAETLYDAVVSLLVNESRLPGA